MSYNDSTLHVDSQSHPVTLNLPAINGNIRFSIVDCGGRSSSNVISVVPRSGDHIVGQDIFYIDSNYGSILVHNDNVNNWYIG